MSFTLNDLEGRLTIDSAYEQSTGDIKVKLSVYLSPEEYDKLKFLLEKDK